MKTIGLIGGISWESTAVYYRLLNEMARSGKGGLHSAELVLWSFNFAEIEALQKTGDWAGATKRMIKAARAVEAGGAECLVICANTMHKMAEEVQAAVKIPLIHIADATAAAIRQSGVNRPLLLATRYTMEEDFYKGRLRDMHGIDVLIPDSQGRNLVHDIIYSELCRGVIEPVSKERCLSIIGQAREDGADSIIFGCTEIGLLISQANLEIPVFDTAKLHARAALDFALKGETGVRPGMRDD